MKRRKGILLFEVVFVMLMVSVISVFLFRGYGLFLKTSRKSNEYVRLILLSEEKLWELHMKESNDEINKDLRKTGECSLTGFSWNLTLDDTDSQLKKCTVVVGHNDRIRLDTVVYLRAKKEEE